MQAFSLNLYYPCLTVACPSGWIRGPDKSKCFKYIESFQSWDESETNCTGFGGHLAALTSDELNFASNLCGQTVTSCWVGGRGVNRTGGFGWKWSDNSIKWNESIVQGVFTSNYMCTLVNNGSRTLVVKGCNASYPYICMLHPGVSSFFLFGI